MLREILLVHLGSCDIPFARGLIAHAARPTLTLSVRMESYENYANGNPDFEAWHLFDTILFAVHYTARARVKLHESSCKDPLIYFPLMSTFWSVV